MAHDVMIQFRLPASVGESPTLADAARHLAVPVGKLSKAYGVVPVDMPDRLYAVMADAKTAAAAHRHLRAAGGDEAEGAFPDIRIEPFGPPEG